jgi:hypothetical protein
MRVLPGRVVFGFFCAICLAISLLPSLRSPPYVARLPDRGVFAAGRLEASLKLFNHGNLSTCRAELIAARRLKWSRTYLSR